MAPAARALGCGMVALSGAPDPPPAVAEAMLRDAGITCLVRTRGLQHQEAEAIEALPAPPATWPHQRTAHLDAWTLPDPAPRIEAVDGLLAWPGPLAREDRCLLADWWSRERRLRRTSARATGADARRVGRRGRHGRRHRGIIQPAAAGDQPSAHLGAGIAARRQPGRWRGLVVCRLRRCRALARAARCQGLGASCTCDRNRGALLPLERLQYAWSWGRCSPGRRTWCALWLQPLHAGRGRGGARGGQRHDRGGATGLMHDHHRARPGPRAVVRARAQLRELPAAQCAASMLRPKRAAAEMS